MCFVFASVAKQSRAYETCSGLLRVARNDNVGYFPTTFYVLRTTNCPPHCCIYPKGYTIRAVRLITLINNNMAEQGYCVKCKAKKDIKDAAEVEMKNGRRALKGSCTSCGTGMFKILGNKK